MKSADDSKRKRQPVVTGALDYFPDALLAVAECSLVANEQHNPGEPMHWSRDKSNDHANSLGRHLLERGTLDSDGVRHSAKVAWRALAILQIEIEANRINRPKVDKLPKKKKSNKPVQRRSRARALG